METFLKEEFQLENYIIYTCDCGKQYTNKQAFYGHQGKCREHLGEERYQKAYNYSIDALRKGTENSTRNRNFLREQKEKEWQSSPHFCVVCGKQFTDKMKYSSGDYCSRSCANTHKRSQESKDRVSNSIYLYNYGATKDEFIQKYNQNPTKCSVCGCSIPFEKRKQRTCSKECAHLAMKRGGINSILSLHDGHIYSNVEPHKDGKMNFKWGTYKGIHCDSSWELAYVMYNLDHDIEFERCIDHFTYYDKNGKSHEYFPDFVQDGEYIEIKNYSTETVELKLQAVIDKGHKIKVLYKKDISPYISYAKNTYGKQYYNLYDGDKPSFKDQVGNKNK